MRLSELLLGKIDLDSRPDPIIRHITDDSREVKPGSLFFAYPGLSVDGRHFITAAVQQGAAAIVYEAIKSGEDEGVVQPSTTIPILPLPYLGMQVGELAARFYGDPSAQMQVIGVTGTNGKTSCTHYLAQLLAKQQQTCAITGTVGSGFLPNLRESQLTTAGAIQLQRNLQEFLQQGAGFVAMEVSSHSLVQHRVAGTHFSIAVLTQLSHDHLDYHGSMEAYATAKAALFAMPNLTAAVVNVDDTLGQLLAKCHASRLPMIAYSVHGKKHPQLPTVIAQNIVTLPRGFEFDVMTPWGDGKVRIPLLGKFSIDNVLAVLAVLGLLNVPFENMLSGLSELIAVGGRMQMFGGDEKPLVIVDYAHTPDALMQVLISLRAHQPRALWCVFGCGGERDRGKRPLMAAVAEMYADHVVITNDNPRQESPQQIVDDMCVGFLNPASVQIELDRARAIRNTLAQAKAGDMVLIAGKGHESVQIIGTQRLPFSDQIQVQQCLD